jgi:hypothetical protein
VTCHLIDPPHITNTGRRSSAESYQCVTHRNIVRPGRDSPDLEHGTCKFSLKIQAQFFLYLSGPNVQLSVMSLLTSLDRRASCVRRATLNQVLYFVGLKSTTPTVACALTNTLPALTFVMAAALKMETVRPGTPAGQAKLVGTAVCVGGSMIIPFYKGPVLRLWASPIHWSFAEHTSSASAPAAAAGGHSGAVAGDVLIIGSCVAWAVWFILQSRMAEGFSAPYTSTAIMCVMAGAQCAGVSAAMDRSLAVWKLGFDIRLYSVLYIVSSILLALLLLLGLKHRNENSALDSHTLRASMYEQQNTGDRGVRDRVRGHVVVHPGARAAVRVHVQPAAARRRRHRRLGHPRREDPRRKVIKSQNLLSLKIDDL